MSALLAVLLAAAWSDTSGQLSCAVPDGHEPVPAQSWTFSRPDGLRRIVFLPVRPVAISPAERAKEVLTRAGASSVILAGNDAASGVLRGAPDLAVALAIARHDPLWAGVMVFAPAAADAVAEARRIAAGCRSATAQAPTSARIWDPARRFSAVLPPATQAEVVQGGVAVGGQGFQVMLISARPRTLQSVAAIAAQWLPSIPLVTTTTIGAGLPVTRSSGTLANGTVMEAAVVDLGPEVAGFVLTSTAAASASAREALTAMIASLSVEVTFSPPPPPPPMPPPEDPRPPAVEPPPSEPPPPPPR